MNELQFLMAWYTSQCNEEWEHGYGVRIETLDNPGWVCEINLNETVMEHVSFEEIVIGDEDSNYDDEGRTIGPWMTCRVNRDDSGKVVFDAHCDPESLGKVLGVFRDWVCANDPAWRASGG